MSINRILILARRVMQQLVADRRTLALLFVVPIVLLTVAGVLIRLEPGTMVIAVVNEDAGLGEGSLNLGERLTATLGAMNQFELEELSAEEAQHRLDDGELVAVISLAEDFTAQTMQTRQLTLNVTFEGSNPTQAERLREALEQVGNQTLARLAVLQGESQPNVPPSDAQIETRLDVAYINGGAEFDTLDYTASALIGVFVFMFVFILTSISFLRERLAGTLERLRATPIHALEIIMGYMLGFLVFGLVQGAITLGYVIFALDVHYQGSLLTIFVVESLLVVTSVNFGIFLSTFARNEFQVLQFIPLIVVTQVFLGGVFWQVEDMPVWLQPLAYLMPLTHAIDALREIMMTGAGLADVWGQLAALLAIALGVMALSTRTASQDLA